MKVSAPIKAACGLILGLAILKPLSYNAAFIFGFLYQLYVPVWLSKSPLTSLFQWGEMKRDFLRVILVSVVTFSCFALGYFYVQNYWAHSRGYEVYFYPVVSWSLANSFLMNLVLVAYPEEVFYRGYLQSHWGLRGILFLNCLFALGHFVGEYDLARLLPFFPGLLFSWLVYKSGSLAGATLYHALCNVFSEWLTASYHWSRT